MTEKAGNNGLLSHSRDLSLDNSLRLKITPIARHKLKLIDTIKSLQVYCIAIIFRWLYAISLFSYNQNLWLFDFFGSYA